MSRPALRAPAAQYGLLVQPSLAEFPLLLESNTQLWSQAKARFGQLTLADLRQVGQQEIHQEAQQYLARLGLPPVDTTSGLPGFIVSGHQPELFHPGVWIKNFASYSLARRQQRFSLNLVVDSDLVKANTLLVPITTGERQQAAFDTGPLQVPYEERTVTDEKVFRQFPERVQEILGPVPWEPWLAKFWTKVWQADRCTPLLGERFTIGRHLWERAQGCHNLEVPISRMCSTTTFAHFALELLTNLPRFHQVHNDSLHEFRSKYRIRSRHHPFPALSEISGWQELPFWAWRTDNPRRARLFASATTHGWMLGVLDKEMKPLSVSIPKEGSGRIAAWQALLDRGWKVRSRALTTTLFARLILADCFIHGIGGGIYDELTDLIIERYYGMKPPGFLVISGTLRLPWPNQDDLPTTMRELRQQRRALEQHPEEFLSPTEPAQAEMLRQLQLLLDGKPQTRKERHHRFLALKLLKAHLSERLVEARQRLEAEIARVGNEEENRRWKYSREYAYCLHPETELQRFFAPFLVPS